ncbi:hypothetical protein PhCBS80983_g02822 [Powellomyces hirtus]|uniref:ABC transporter domain-containing protein n=1 Tax=Powellomyces hirtus TaxID=109895 RepID=A0A507E460_9FUNG|nr:hypothetical protein PhCBS80983_g02822 [Powellomyces hirtus]
MPLLIGAAYVLVKIETVMLGRASHALGQATSVADQALAGIRTVYSFSLQRRFADNYPARPDIQILNGLSAEVKAGQTVALVRRSGSGISTTVACCRGLDPSAGNIYLDGRIYDQWINSLAKPDWIVGQEPVLFALTIKQNILLGLGGRDNVPPARFITVCKMAHSHDFICIFPLGYETPVTQGVLSWGQKQRIAIACALIKEVKILLLDEATSALDSKAESLVQRALDAAARGRTTIVTAHRLSTVRNADVIYVMNRGQVIEQGNHKELLARNGVYTSLVDKQKLSGHEEDSKSSVVERGIESADAPDAVMNDQVRRMMQESVLVMDSPEVIAKQTQLRLKEDKLRQQSENDAASSRIVRSAEMMTTEGWSVAGGTIAAGIGGLAFPGFAIVLGLVLGKISKEETADTYIAMKGEELIFSGHPLIWVPRDCSPPTWIKIAAFGKVDARLTSRLRLAVFQNWMRQEMGFFDRKENASSVLTYKLSSIAEVSHCVTDVWGKCRAVRNDCIYRCLLFLTFLPGFDGYPSSSADQSVLHALHHSPSGLLLFSILNQSLPIIRRRSFFSPAASKRTPQPAFAAKSAEATEQAASVAGEAVRDMKRNAVIDSLADAFQSTTAMLVLCIGSLAGKSLYERGEIDISNTITATLGMMTTMISVASAAAATTGYSKGRFAAKMTFLLHDRKSAIDPDKGGQMPGEFKAGFNYQNLWFQYPTSTEPTFRGEFNLEGKKNTFLALVGPSGCGKSTIIGLLQGWYDASGGDATIDHIPIRNYAVMKRLRSNMALVGQEPVLFDMSIAENIAWGSEVPVTRDEVIEAAKQADVHAFTSALPQGYDTRVGAKRGHLSGASLAPEMASLLKCVHNKTSDEEGSVSKARKRLQSIH